MAINRSLFKSKYGWPEIPGVLDLLICLCAYYCLHSETRLGNDGEMMVAVSMLVGMPQSSLNSTSLSRTPERLYGYNASSVLPALPRHSGGDRCLGPPSVSRCWALIIAMFNLGRALLLLFLPPSPPHGHKRPVHRSPEVLRLPKGYKCDYACHRPWREKCKVSLRPLGADVWGRP